jgi:hypothetical protein
MQVLSVVMSSCRKMISIVEDPCIAVLPCVGICNSSTIWVVARHVVSQVAGKDFSMDICRQSIQLCIVKLCTLQRHMDYCMNTCVF